MAPQERIGKIQISSKKAVISLVEGEYEEVQLKLTSGIPGKHGKGGQSRNRFARKREEEVNAFLRKVQLHADKVKAQRWIFEGDKELVKQFKKTNCLSKNRKHAK